MERGLKGEILQQNWSKLYSLIEEAKIYHQHVLAYVLSSLSLLIAILLLLNTLLFLFQGQNY